MKVKIVVSTCLHSKRLRRDMSDSQAFGPEACCYFHRMTYQFKSVKDDKLQQYKTSIYFFFLSPGAYMENTTTPPVCETCCIAP